MPMLKLITDKRKRVIMVALDQSGYAFWGWSQPLLKPMDVQRVWKAEQCQGSACK